jgi:hypothetical protein
MWRYLASKYPEKGLGGTDAEFKTLVDNWLKAEAENLNPHTEVRLEYGFGEVMNDAVQCTTRPNATHHECYSLTPMHDASRVMPVTFFAG